MKIILNGENFNNLEIDGEVSITNKNNTKLKIKKIKSNELISTQIQKQLESQASLIYFTTNLTYKFKCQIDSTTYSDCFIKSVEYGDLCVTEEDQYITLTIISTGLPSLEK